MCQVVHLVLVKHNLGNLLLKIQANETTLYKKRALLMVNLFSMQLAINVQIPKEADGVGGSAVYIGP